MLQVNLTKAQIKLGIAFKKRDAMGVTIVPEDDELHSIRHYFFSKARF